MIMLITRFCTLHVLVLRTTFSFWLLAFVLRAWSSDVIMVILVVVVGCSWYWLLINKATQRQASAAIDSGEVFSHKSIQAIDNYE